MLNWCHQRQDERISNIAKLTQDGEDAEQDGHQGVSAQSHLASAGIALHVDPPGVAAARLQERQQTPRE